MSDLPSTANYLSPKLVVRECTDKPGRGVFAAAPVEAGEVVAVWGGRIVARAAAEALPPALRRYVVQVEEAQFLAPLEPIDAAELINHCCQPTCGLVGQITLVALRRIQPGEEITFDYATTDSADFLGFPCRCAKAPCRGRVAADDWQRPDVQAANRGHFSPYLQRRIEAAGATIPFKRRHEA
jgi:hypothetical protein